MIFQVRRRLLGLEGPYVDPRVGIDPLDNFKLWVEDLSRSEQRLAFDALLECALDLDIQVATGAILALDLVGGAFDHQRVIELLKNYSSELQRSPRGFSAAYLMTLFEELFSRLARCCPSDRVSELELLLKAASPPTRRSTLLASLAERFPQIVVYYARQYLVHDDVQVLAALPEQWQRVAVAGALRPWTNSAINRVEQLWQIRKLNSNDTLAITSVMLDQYPRLTRPPGLTDQRHWWIIAANPHVWTVWEAEDGTLALETPRPGGGFASDSRLMSPQQQAQFRERRSISHGER
ncbi:MAG: hypothetical protein JNL67_16590 [Planctomycetaceae bacterium]|nr:hypothetical protein [Planctomycetaceae bacterium]